MFRFVKQIFVSAMMFFGCNALNAIPLKCVSMSNEECRRRPEITNINSNEPWFCPYSVKINKCSDSSNNINDPYTKMCAPDVVKNINVKLL